MAVVNPYNYAKPKRAPLGDSAQVNKIKKTDSIASNIHAKSDAYFTQKVMNAKPEELTLMLYEGMIKFIKLAKHHLSKNNYEGVNTYSIKAQNIVVELSSTLDKNYEVSEDLGHLYDFLYSELIEANLSKNEESFDNALEIAEELSYTWKEVMKLA